MASPIIRIVRLIFDRNAGRRTETDAKRSLSVMERGLKRIKKLAVELGLALGLAFAIRKMAQWGAAAIRAGIGAEETFSKFNTVFGESARTLDGFIKDWGALAGVTKSQGQEMVAQYGAIAQGFGLTQEASAQFSARLVELAGDLTSFNDVPIEETFQALRSGLTETEPLKRFGIVISLAEVKQRALVETQKDNIAELTRQEILQARVNLIIERAGKANGDLARTQNSTANMLRQLNGAWKQFQESLGIAIVKSNDATGIIGQLTNALKDATHWVEENEESFRLLGDVLGFIFRMLGTVLGGWVRLSTFVASGWVGIMATATSSAGAFLESLGAIVRGLQKTGQFFGFAMEGTERAANILDFEAEKLLLRANELFGTMDELQAMAVRASSARPTDTGGEDSPFVPTEVPETLVIPSVAESEEQAKALEALEADALAIFNSMKTAAEEYAETIQSLDAHLAAGRITQETYNRAVADADQILADAAEEIGNVSQALSDHEAQMVTNGILAGVLGDDFNALEEEAVSLTAILIVMAEAGLDPLDQRFQDIVARLREVKEALDADAESALEVGKAATLAGQMIGAAFGAGIGPLAASKARQNAILAAEQLAQGFVSLLNPVTIHKAGGHFAAAAKFTAIAASWKALSASVGGGGGGAAASTGGSPSVGRGAGGATSEALPGTEVHIHFVGDGFDAVNPRVQRVVAGALQMVEERFGENTTVRIHREGG